MQADNIVNDTMTIDEKLAAIDAAMAQAKVDFNKRNGRSEDAPVDPAILTVCDGCE